MNKTSHSVPNSHVLHALSNLLDRSGEVASEERAGGSDEIAVLPVCVVVVSSAYEKGGDGHVPVGLSATAEVCAERVSPKEKSVGIGRSYLDENLSC